jgi:hypothetical protein
VRQSEGKKGSCVVLLSISVLRTKLFVRETPIPLMQYRVFLFSATQLYTGSFIISNTQIIARKNHACHRRGVPENEGTYEGKGTEQGRRKTWVPFSGYVSGVKSQLLRERGWL